MGNKEPIRISDDRMRHIRGVAEQAYRIAFAANLGEEFARKMYVLGFLHDVGYALNGNPSSHPKVGASVLGDSGYAFSAAVGLHGNPDAEQSVALAILNVSDMTVDGYGRLVTMSERLTDIASRHGDDSRVTQECVRLVDMLRSVVPGMVALAEAIVLGHREDGE